MKDESRILIYGGAGFIGRNLTEELVKLGHIVTWVDPACGVHKASKELLEESDVIIHLASVVGVGNVEDDPVKTTDTTYDTIKEILPYCTEDRIVLYASTSEVYGDCAYPMSEDMPISISNLDNVRSCYKMVKLLAESIITAKGGIVIRPFNVTGVGQTIANAVIPKMVDDAMNGSILVYGKGDQSRAFMHIDDAVRSIIHILTIDNPQSTYNIGNPHNSTTMLKLALKIQDLIPTAEIKSIPFNDVHSKSIDILYRQPNVDRIGLTYEYNLDNIIEDIVNGAK